MKHTKHDRETENELDTISEWLGAAEKRHEELSGELRDKLRELDEQLDTDESRKALNDSECVSAGRFTYIVDQCRTPETESLVDEIIDMVWQCEGVACEIEAYEDAIHNGIDGYGTLEERLENLVERHREVRESFM